jgi:hypothetical protein
MSGVSCLTCSGDSDAAGGILSQSSPANFPPKSPCNVNLCTPSRKLRTTHNTSVVLQSAYIELAERTAMAPSLLPMLVLTAAAAAASAIPAAVLVKCVNSSLPQTAHGPFVVSARLQTTKLRATHNTSIVPHNAPALNLICTYRNGAAQPYINTTHVPQWRLPAPCHASAHDRCCCCHTYPLTAVLARYLHTTTNAALPTNEIVVSVRLPNNRTTQNTQH